MKLPHTCTYNGNDYCGTARVLAKLTLDMDERELDMSYFSHNPEAWDEIERRGVCRWLGGEWDDNVDTMLTEMQMAGVTAGVWKELTRLALREITNEQSDYFTSFAH